MAAAANAVAFDIVILALLVFSAAVPALSQPKPKLPTNYYRKRCPRFDQIMQETTTDKQIKSPTTAAATLRIFLHDCLPQGCDASVLISSTPFHKAERDADINLSLPGDGFDVVVRAKAALELACPNTVSCADILAVATRNLVSMAGGPYYPVGLGRKDGLVSDASYIPGNLPLPTMLMSQIVKMFQARGFSAQEMVALSGAHTIGFSHCKEFSSNIYNYSRAAQSDPTYNPRFASALRDACKNYQKDPTISVVNDIMSPHQFDNKYYQNLPKGLGLLSSDRGMHSDSSTRGFVEMYARDQDAFFRDFAAAMVKLSELNVKTGRQGEIRRRCDAFNH